MTEDRVPTRLADMKPEDDWGDKFYTALGELWRAVKGTEIPAMPAPPHVVMAGLIEDVKWAAAQPPPPLDVERLARVLAEHFGPSYFPGMTDVTIHGKTPEAIAEQIAAEYERLARND